MKRVNSNISVSHFNKINNSLHKELNKLVYKYTTDYTFQHFDEMIAKLQDKILWGYIKRREDKISIVYYGDDETIRITIHKTFDYNEIYEDDVFFEQMLISFRKYYLWLKETPDEEKQTLQSYKFYLHRTARHVHSPLMDKAAQKYLESHEACHYLISSILEKEYGFCDQDFDNFCKYIYYCQYSHVTS
jgi:hypothetical protein